MEVRVPKARAQVGADWCDAILPSINGDASAGATMATLVRAIGTPQFPSMFGHYAQTTFGAEQATVIRFREDGGVLLLYGENFRYAGLIDELWDTYSKRFYRLDPLQHHTSTNDEARPHVRHVSRHTVRDPDYYRSLFWLPGLTDKLSAITRIGRDRIFTNMYRGAGSPAWPIADADAMEAFTTAAAAVEAHFRGVIDLENKSTATTFPLPVAHLSAREREVCHHILRGLSLEGVAMEMNVSFNTAATFKRRAFTKLRISTSKELFHLALAAAPADRP